MIVYIAAPYSNGNPAQNVHNVLKIADALIERGHIPFIPHLSYYWHLVSPKPLSFWYDYDNVFLRMCDCVLRADGKSEGADKEVELARKLGIPVFYDVCDIPL